MDDFIVLENLFEKHDDQIHFDLFKESNIIAHNNNNQGNFLTKRLILILNR